MSTRITVRLDDALYARLLLFAQGRSQGQALEVSTIVREALEEYLTPKVRQTIDKRLSDKSPKHVRHEKAAR